MKKKILAFTLTALMVCQLGVFAFADTQECTEQVYIEESNVITPAENPENYGITDQGDSVSVKGSTITTSDECGIWAEASTVTVDKSKITTSGSDLDGIHADCAVVTINDSTISTDPSGDALWGVYIADSSVTINNSEITTTTDHSNGVYASANSDINITDSKITATGGDNSAGVKTLYSCPIAAFNSIVTGTTGVDVAVDDTNVILLDSTVTSTGTKADGDAALKILLEADTAPDQATIIVDKLQVTKDAPLVSAVDSYGNDRTEDVAKQISYIMHSIENATVTGTTKLFAYDVAKENDTLLVKVTDGYELQSNSQHATVLDNHDGTYTITVNRGGDLYFTARVKYVPAANTTVASVATNFMKGNKNDTAQPVMVVNMKASHFQKVMVDGTDLAEGNFVIGAKGNGLLTFQFSTSYIRSLAAGTYYLQFVTTENVTHTMKLVVAEDGTYTVSY